MARYIEVKIPTVVVAVVVVAVAAIFVALSIDVPSYYSEDLPRF